VRRVRVPGVLDGKGEAAPLSCWRCGTPIPLPLGGLHRLREETDRVIRGAFLDGVEDSVDWSTVRCAEARVIVDERGVRYQVHIRGAAPDADWLREYVRDRLSRSGWDTEVITSW